MNLIADFWKGDKMELFETHELSEEDIINSLEKYDASSYTLIVLSSNNDFRMTISGGDGKYVVVFETPDEKNWTLKPEYYTEGKVQMFVGGQPTVYQAYQVVDKTRATDAIIYFYHYQQMTPKYGWLNN